MGEIQSEHKLYEKLLLHVKDTQIIIEPFNDDEHDLCKFDLICFLIIYVVPALECLTLNRIEYSVELFPKSSLNINSYELYKKLIKIKNTPNNKTPTSSKEDMFESNNVIVIYGVVGIISLLAGHYLICITDREKICDVRDKTIYKATDFEIIQIPVDLLHLTDDEQRTERDLIDLVENFLDDSEFYFSYSYDITHNVQKQSQFQVENNKQALWERADERFFWNKNLIEDLIENKIREEYIIPMMDGFIKCFTDTFNDREFMYILISRRGCTRTGARYHMRGADPLGYVANFVETEQLIQYDIILSSFLQIRGSIPVIWNQLGKQLKPKPIAVHSYFTKQSLQYHLDNLVKLYKNVICVNLIDQVGNEADLGSHFETQVKLYNNTHTENPCHYVGFDFHAKCKNNKYENLVYLIESIQSEIKKYGYHLQDNKGNSIINQTGIIRTNCIDCLDRTNVVQSMVAMFMLKSQLHHLGVIQSDWGVEQVPKFQIAFKNIWADNADRMSQAYTGTSALKTDFTRTGRRSMKGIATDGLNSVRRVINKTFSDNTRQQAIDLFLGKFKVGKLNFIDDTNIVRFTVSKLEEEDLNKEITSAYLDVHLQLKFIREYIIESGQQRIFNFNNIFIVEKSYNNYRQVKLLLTNVSLSYYYNFSSVVERQKFVELINNNINNNNYNNNNIGNNNDNNSNNEMKNVINKKAKEEYVVYVGSWNMTGVNECPTTEVLETWMPQLIDKKNEIEIIIIAVQNCKYKIPMEYQDNNGTCKYHWFLTLETFIGDQFTVVSSSSTYKNQLTTDLIVFVNKNRLTKITNIVKTKALQKIIEKNNSTNNNGNNNSNSGNLLSGNGIKNRLIQARDKIKEVTTTRSDRNNNNNDITIIGGAITLRIDETTMCILNTLNNNNNSINTISNTKGKDNNNNNNNNNSSNNNNNQATVGITNEQEIGAKYEHIIWVGQINEKNVIKNKWTQLTKNNQNGTIYYRSLSSTSVITETSVVDNINSKHLM